MLCHTRARMKAKALVTGAGGLIGSACVQTLCEDGWDVIGIDNDGRSVFSVPRAAPLKPSKGCCLPSGTTVISAWISGTFRGYEYYVQMPVGIFRGSCLTGPQHAAAELHGYWPTSCAAPSWGSPTQYMVITASRLGIKSTRMTLLAFSCNSLRGPGRRGLQPRGRMEKQSVSTRNHSGAR